jgi:hypothetical protein
MTTGDLYLTFERKGSSWLWLVRFLGGVVALTVVREIFRAIDAGAIVMSSRRDPVVRLESPADMLLGSVFLALVLISGAGVAVAPRYMLRRRIIGALLLAIGFIRLALALWTS